MENYQYNNPSYPDSVNSSPRSRDIDPENASWDEPLSSSNNYKVKFMCSYGGNIRPRPHDNQLTYMGGDTKILSVDRGIKFSSFISKLSALSDSPEVCFKYQLPGEDLDALISVTNDEDLELMMLEYDRLYRSNSKPARLRLFIFPASGNPPSMSSFGSDDSKPETQWFLDALNAAQVNQNPKDNSTPQSTAAVGAAEPTRVPDYLFGLEKGGHRAPPSKFRDPSPEVTPPSVVVGEPVVTPADLQRQIHELQRMQISNQEQEMYGRKLEDYYQQKPPPQPAQQLAQVTPGATAAFWQERQGHQAFPAGMGVGGTEGAPMYLIQTPAGVYQAPMNMMRPPMTGQAGQVNQPYYGVPRMVPEQGYREQQPAAYNPIGQPVSSSIIQQQQQQQQKPGGAVYNAGGIGLVRPSVGLGPPPPPLEPGYAQVSFNNTGRQVYYNAPDGVNVMQQQPPPPPLYLARPTAAAQVIDGRQAGTLNPDGKIVVKNSQ